MKERPSLISILIPTYWLLTLHVILTWIVNLQKLFIVLVPSSFCQSDVCPIHFIYLMESLPNLFFLLVDNFDPLVVSYQMTIKFLWIVIFYISFSFLLFIIL